MSDTFRNWVFLIYEDSAPSNFLIYLDSLQVPCIISPLHNCDLNEDGTLKKAHYHCILSFEGKKSYNQVLSLVSPLGVNIVKSVNSLKASVQYFVHLNNKDKAKYSVNDIIVFNGFDYQQYFVNDNKSVLFSLQKLVLNNHVKNMNQLLSIIFDTFDDVEASQYIDFIIKNSYFVNLLFK